eukprot:TRINITY_DN3900_c0_g1_i1.p1 TRINITY_DN3900_c0_g1~~TRINITY_DN3900_c0_g1_i1.p1  ORF type:complete len:558 (-),score=114.44 TRINITY_DN3900_c0_g1_i1:813-2486(-)
MIQRLRRVILVNRHTFFGEKGVAGALHETIVRFRQSLADGIALAEKIARLRSWLDQFRPGKRRLVGQHSFELEVSQKERDPIAAVFAEVLNSLITQKLDIIETETSMIMRVEVEPEKPLDMDAFAGDHCLQQLREPSEFTHFKQWAGEDHSIENVLLWELLERSMESENPQENSDAVYHSFIAPGAPHEAFLDQQLKDAMTKQFETENKLDLAKLQLAVYLSIKNSAYPLYVESEEYQSRPAVRRSLQSVEERKDLDHILQHRPDILNCLLSYSKQEYSAEALLFWLEVRRVLRAKDNKLALYHAQGIMHRYLSSDSPLALGLPSTIVRSLEMAVEDLRSLHDNNSDEFTINDQSKVMNSLFVEASRMCTDEVKRGVFPRFLRSKKWNQFKKSNRRSSHRLSSMHSASFFIHSSRKGSVKDMLKSPANNRALKRKKSIIIPSIVPKTPTIDIKKDCCGFLMQYTTEGWRRRWFRMSTSMIGVFADPGESVIFDLMDLKELRALCRSHKSKTRLEFSFVLAFKNSDLILEGGCKEDKEKWIESVKIRLRTLNVNYIVK